MPYSPQSFAEAFGTLYVPRERGPDMLAAALSLTKQLGELSPEDWDAFGDALGEGMVKSTNVYKALFDCAQLVGGACGGSGGLSGSYIALGVRGSADIFVDQTGNIGLLTSVGGGGYATFSGVSGKGGSLTGTVIHNIESLEELEGNGVQFGVSGSIGVGFTAEWLTGRNAQGEPYHGVSAGWAPGAGAELHGTYTYTWVMLRSDFNR